MLAEAERDFSSLARLGDPQTNRQLLAALEARGAGNDAEFLRANLLRRMGDLASARDVLARWIERERPAGVGPLHPWSAIPAGLFTQDTFALAPLVVIDDFLPVVRMQALHAHACEREPLFERAKAGAAPAYDPDRRKTLLDWMFTLEREEFQGFVTANLGQLRTCLGLADFEVSRLEIKLSNHVDGGFFKIHADNHDPTHAEGRAITWLYYFDDGEGHFDGGDLLLVDTDLPRRDLSRSWFTRVLPRRNRFIAFPSWFFHAVSPTRLHSHDFAHGRFAISGHVRKVADAAKGWWEKETL